MAIVGSVDQLTFRNNVYEIVPEIAPLFQETESYDVGDWVIYEAKLYKFISSKSAGVWDATKVDGPFKVTDQISSIKEDLNAVFVVDSASGSVAHFEDGADGVPMKSVKVNIAPIQSGSGDPSPSNVRTISGWSSVKVTRSGKNLLEPWIASQVKNGVTYTTSSDGTIVTSGQATANSQILSGRFLLPAGDYALSGCPSGGSGETYFLRALLYNGNTLVRILNSDYGTGATFTISESDADCEIIVFSAIQNGKTVNATWKPMIEVGTSATAYEPYNSNEYNISLASAGTVYGGTFDAVSGELTVDKTIVDLGTLTWTKRTDSSGVYFTATKPTGETAPESPTHASMLFDGICSIYQVSASNNVFDGSIAMGAGNSTAIYVRDSRYTDASAFTTAIQGAQLCYKLKTPQTVQLAETQIKSLLGINNVWSDAGDMDVEYRADTKLYIKRLTDSDTDMIADANITSGQYFMVGNDLYRATVNIASGAQIVVGTNATRVSLSEALNEINA